MALTLFNMEGVERVAVHRIATELGISPGNLTYHFAKRKDIIGKLVDRLEQQLLGTWDRPELATEAEEMARSLIDLFGIMWDFRFFFSSISFLFEDDQDLRERYVRLEDRIFLARVAIIEAAIEAGYMRRIVAPSSPELLAGNMWDVSIATLAFDRIRHGSRSSRKADALLKCFMRHVSLIQPYSDNLFLQELVAIAEKKIAAYESAEPPAPRRRQGAKAARARKQERAGK